MDRMLAFTSMYPCVGRTDCSRWCHGHEHERYLATIPPKARCVIGDRFAHVSIPGDLPGWVVYCNHMALHSTNASKI
eukprot:m.1216676 g.1216676  ORF g.1216676 m.1216676 type:complete len:77 (+) comp24614_c0_seq16:663-893(+)